MATFGFNLLIILMACVLTTQGQQEEDSYMEAYHQSHYAGQYFNLDDMTFRMPVEEQRNDSIIPQVLKIAALVGKVLLKLTLFKIIVKFIAVVCLLLFIPKLKFEKRSILDDSGDNRHVNELAEMVRESLQKYETFKEI